MASPRRPTQHAHPDAVFFIERLRLLTIVRALEATIAGIPRELHLEAVCLALRHAVEREYSPNWGWIRCISHPENAGLDDFVFTTTFRCEEALDLAAKPSLDATARKAVKHLLAVLSGERVASRAQNGERNPSSTDHAPLPPRRIPDAGQAAPLADAFTAAASGSFVSATTDAGEEQSFLVADVDSRRPPAAQRTKGIGLIFQSIEDSQFLRHSWHRLGKHEVPAFFARLVELRDGAELQDRLGTALVGIAVAASVPLSGISRIRVQSELIDDWTVDLRQGCLRRRPPRVSRGWNPNSASADWVQPTVNEWQIVLPVATQSSLRGLRKRGGVSLDALWDDVSPNVTLEHWFGSRFAIGETLSRLTSPVISNALAQDFYEANGDHAEARLLTSSTRSAIPAACMYGSFRFDEVRRTWDRGLHPELGSMLALGKSALGNAAGSELDVDLARLRNAIGQLTHRVNVSAADGNEWVAHHNLLTALCIVTLFASTGARPVNSPFESSRWFDFDRRIVYVEDKRSGPTQGARLCVLSDIAHRLLSERYFPHIESLQRALASRAPGFAARLSKIANPDVDGDLPLFFFLRVQPNFDWIEVSSTQLDIVCANPWPLPWNLFRHLQSTQLRRKGLPAEIRDALLSHGERGAESHGEFSWRTPCDDLEVARPLINLLANDLGLSLPSTGAPPIIAPARLAEPDFSQGASFGRQAREICREKVHAAAKRVAQADIDRLLTKRPPQSLSAADWETIARRMIVREDGMAHPMGSLRVEVFEDYLTQLWRDKRVRVDSRRRYFPMKEGRAWFDEDVIAAPDSIASLRVDVDRICEGLKRPPRPDLAGCLAALELGLHCRVSNFAVLAAVARNLPSVNVVRFQDRHWLEYAHHGDWVDGRPVYRVPITARAAGWITLRKGAKKRLKTLPPVPEPLKGLGGIRSERFTEVLRRVADLVAQANAFDLPCTIAAFLRGTHESSALPHSDWVRTTFLQAPLIEETIDPDVKPPAYDPAQFLTSHGPALAIGDAGDLSRCAALFDAIQEVLIGPRGMSTREMASDVSQLLKRSGFSKGSAPFVLTHYVHYLLTRPKKTDASKTLRATTALRYWYALKPGFLDFAYDIHLPALDDEDVTELYRRIVEAAETSHDKSGARATGAGSARRRQLMADTDGGKRTFEELWSFHEFARDIYGLEEPDWSEVSPGICAGSGRPGLVLMAEYEAILATLAVVEGCSSLDESTLSAAFVAVACARFGLRIGEAVGMSYGDWVEVDGAIVVLVRHSAIRVLKNDASKRQVPLVGQLNALEREVVTEVRRRWILREDPQKLTASLLPGVESTTFGVHRNRIAKRLLPLIKAATGNLSSTVHHLRHGFACRLLTLLHGHPCGLGLPCDDQRTRSARRLLLQADAPDRRTLWAVARALGHASGVSSLKSYLHVLDQWLPPPPIRLSLFDSPHGPEVVDLDAIPRVDLISRLEPIAVSLDTPSEPLFERYIQHLRLRARRHRDPSKISRVSAAELLRLEDALVAVTSRLISKPGVEAQDLLIRRVTEKRWRGLASLAGTVRTLSPAVMNSDWLPTIGSSRQIVLFHPVHFDWMARFLAALGLQANDCSLVHRNNAGPETLHLASDPILCSLLSPSTTRGEKFQLDVAVERLPRKCVYPDRMVMIPKPGGKVDTTYELLLLWVAWLCAGQAG
jgi:integrase